MSKVTLFDDQQVATDEILNTFKKGIRRLILQAETGWGKSVIIAYMASNAIKKGRKVLILTNRTELLDGTAEALVDFKIHPFLINADSKKLNISHDVYVAMSQTIRRRITDASYSNWVKSYFDLILIDECHTNEYNWFFTDEHARYDAYICGLTATPRRTGKQRQLAEDYYAIVEGLQTQDLVTLKRLAAPIYHKVNKFRRDVKLRVSTKSGEEDYNEVDAAKAMDVDALADNLIEAYNKFAKGKITIMFCAGSANVIKACVLLNQNGIKARYLISEPQEKEGIELHKKYKHLYSGYRKTLIKQWKKRDFDCMVNNGILTTGFNYPKIEVAFLNRITMSLNLYKQMIGRASRYVKDVKEVFEVVDMGDNIDRLKEWHYPHQWSLKHTIGEKGIAPTKECPHCKQVVFATTRTCKRINPKTLEICNFTFPTFLKTKLEAEFETIEYKTYSYGDILKNKHKLPFEELEKLRKEKGFRYSWLEVTASETNREDEFLNFTVRTGWKNLDKLKIA
jgi:superfamily II DNA or RNA helicase